MSLNLGCLSRQQAEDAIRARSQSVFLGDDLVLARVLGSYKMLLRASDRGFSRHVMLDGYWESWLTVFCARTLRHGMTAFDVGANLGYYTLLFGDCVGLAGRVLAIEPNPATFSLLEQTVLLNGFDRICGLHQAAAMEKADETLRLFVPLGEPKNATVAFAGTDRPSEMIVSVPSVVIDDLAVTLDRVDFVKIDVEGAEEAVLRGMSRTIERFRPTIVLEYNAARYDDPRGLLDRLHATYPSFGEIDFEGQVQPVKIDDLLNSRPGEDRLLCFAGAAVPL